MSNKDIPYIISPEIIDIPEFKPKIKLAIMASGKGTNFEAIIKSTIYKLAAEIQCLIVNKEECGAINIAKKYNIKYEVINHKDYGSREEFDIAIIGILKKYNVDFIVMAGWMRIVTPTLIQSFKKRIINIHPSLLPSFKGTNAIEQAIESKVKITGCTAHIVEEQVDSGEILIQGVLPIKESDTSASLLCKIQDIEHKILYKAIAIAAKNYLNLP